MSAIAPAGGAVAHIRAATSLIPTHGPGSDGTFAWDAKTIVVVERRRADERWWA